MEMTQSSSYSQATPSPTPSSVASIYTHPSDVTNDATLTIAEKKAILASWISDARAVEDAHSLRRLDSGAVVLLMRFAGPLFRSMNRVLAAEKLKAIGFYTSNASVAWSPSG
jgi:hypothetical protein